MSEDSLRRGSLWMLSGQSAALGAQAVYFVFIGRALGSRDYGAFAGVIALIAVLAQFSSLGMEMILVRNLSRDRASFARTWGHALAVSFLGFLVLFVAAATLAHVTLRPELRALVPFIALADGLFGKFIQLASRAFQGAGQLSVTARLAALSAAARATAAAALFLYARTRGFHPTALLWTRLYCFSTLAAAVVALTLVTRRLGRPRFASIRRSDLSEGLSFSLSSSSISIYNDIDKTFLISLGQPVAAGVYAAAYRVIDSASTPVYAVYAAATPRFFRHGAAGVRPAREFARTTLARTLPYSLLAAAGLWAAAPLVPLLFGPTFRESVAALRWLCLLPVLRALHYSWGTAITASASQWNRTATQFSAAAFNLLLNFLLIPRLSWRGAAVASLLTDGFLAAASWCVLARLQRREERETRPATA